MAKLTDILLYLLVLVFSFFNHHENGKSHLSEPQLQYASMLPFAPSTTVAPAAVSNTSPIGFVVMHGKKTAIKGNTSQLHSFFDALSKARQKRIHIAHWGDSIIMGDVISEYLRENLQKQFGGDGAGFVSIKTDEIRSTTRVGFSNDWQESSLSTRNSNKLPLGINGAVFVPSEGSWVKYEVGRFNNHLRVFSSGKLFYANAPQGAYVTCTFSNHTVQTLQLESGKNLKKLDIWFPSGSSDVTITFRSCSGGYFYGVSFENGEGVYVDNFPIRGNSGVGLGDIPINVLREFNSYMNYKFLIINFGVNTVSNQYSNYIWYETQMSKVIDYLQRAFPQTSILLISVGDKDIKKGSNFITDPGIPLLLRSQEKIAAQRSIGYWNMYEAMGGANIIRDWVEATPALAYKDYCHLTNNGGRVIADLLVDALFDEMKKSY
jgi:hypothetical protein